MNTEPWDIGEGASLVERVAEDAGPFDSSPSPAPALAVAPLAQRADVPKRREAVTTRVETNGAPRGPKSHPDRPCRFDAAGACIHCGARPTNGHNVTRAAAEPPPGFFDDGPEAEAPAAARSEDEEFPTAMEPLRGLHHLAKVAVIGRASIQELAERPIVWIWDYIATAGLVVLLAAGPGSGKTTLLFLLIVARANPGQPVKVLGRVVAPAPPGRWIVIIENEHSDESAARMLRKSCGLLGLGDEPLDRILLVARGNVRIGSPEWADVERLIGAGLVSDVLLDTLARCAPFDANDEQEQVEVFSRLAQAIERAPTAESRPTVWLAAHTRKCEGMPTLDDVSGSAQRTGQADVVVLMGAQRSGDRVVSVKAAFGKVREKDAEDWPPPVEYIVKKSGVVLVGAPEDDGRPLEERILARLEVGGPLTANALGKALARSSADVQSALSNLFAARRLTTTTVKVRGRDCKAFKKRDGAPSPVSTGADEGDQENSE